jgi:hypothetical protein
LAILGTFRDILAHLSLTLRSDYHTNSSFDHRVKDLDVEGRKDSAEMGVRNEFLCSGAQLGVGTMSFSILA